MKKFFILTMAATLMLASCMQVGGSFDTQDRAEIQFQPMTETMTKAPLTAFPNGRTMRVAARYFPDGTLNTGSPANYFPATTYTYSTSNGYASSTGDQVRYWPLDNTGYLNFLSYSTALSVTGETWGSNYTTSLNFTTPDNSTTQDDILVGSKFQATRTATNGNQITFKHAQALIAFQAKSNVAYNSTTNAGITVTGITMNAAAHQGTLAVTRDDASASGVFTGITWTTSTANNKNNVTVPGSTTSRNLTASYQDICTNGIMMPQQTDGGQYIVISYVMHNGKNGTSNNDINMTYRYNMDGRTWLPGNKYIIQFYFQENAITVTTTILDWGNGGTVEQILPEPDPANGHEYVEIAGIKWATMNVGATSVTDYGLYFQWGDISGYTSSQVGSGANQKPFNWEDYKYNDGTSSPAASNMTKYNATDGKTVLDLSDDGVRANWGGLWRMPTTAEFAALGNAVTTAWTADYQGTGVAGMVCTDKTDNTKVLFFPAAGCALSGSMDSVGSDGFYWSSSLYSSNVLLGRYLYFSSGNVLWQTNFRRRYGFSLRGVLDE